MIVVFGASTDIGRRLVERLGSAGLACRKVSRTLDGAARADLQTGEGVIEAVSGATTIVSCAHAKHTGTLLDVCPTDVQLVLVGSAWRYSKVPNQSADLVREAEALFLKSNHRGVMLHPTMIYGGAQENNIRRLMRVIQRLPFVPAPGGGHQIVCPIYIDDLVDCLNAAVNKTWDGKSVVGIAGPSLTWRRMAELVAQSIGLRRPIVSVPIRPIVLTLELLQKAGINLLDANILRRFGEDVDISVDPMRETLSVIPRSFESGILSAVENWRREGAL